MNIRNDKYRASLFFVELTVARIEHAVTMPEADWGNEPVSFALMLTTRLTAA